MKTLLQLIIHYLAQQITVILLLCNMPHQLIDYFIIINVMYYKDKVNCVVITKTVFKLTMVSYVISYNSQKLDANICLKSIH